MWPDQVSNPGFVALESDTLATALCSLAQDRVVQGQANCVLVWPGQRGSMLVISLLQ